VAHPVQYVKCIFYLIARNLLKSEHVTEFGYDSDIGQIYGADTSKHEEGK